MKKVSVSKKLAAIAVGLPLATAGLAGIAADTALASPADGTMADISAPDDAPIYSNADSDSEVVGYALLTEQVEIITWDAGNGFAEVYADYDFDQVQGYMLQSHLSLGDGLSEDVGSDSDVEQEDDSDSDNGGGGSEEGGFLDDGDWGDSGDGDGDDPFDSLDDEDDADADDAGTDDDDDVDGMVVDDDDDSLTPVEEIDEDDEITDDDLFVEDDGSEGTPTDIEAGIVGSDSPASTLALAAIGLAAVSGAAVMYRRKEASI